MLEIGNGIPEMRPLREARKAFDAIGFKVEHEEDLAERADEVPWYYPLEGDFRKAQTPWDLVMVWRTSWSGRIVTHTGLGLLEMLGLVPKGTWEVCETLKIAGDALVKGGQTKVIRSSRCRTVTDLFSSYLRPCISSLPESRWRSDLYID